MPQKTYDYGLKENELAPSQTLCLLGVLLQNILQELLVTTKCLYKTIIRGSAAKM